MRFERRLHHSRLEVVADLAESMESLRFYFFIEQGLHKELDYIT